MDREPMQGKATKTVFVYDTQTGKVVHIHQFVPAEPEATVSDREMQDTALKLAPADWDRARLSVLHYGPDLELNPEYLYRVDVKARRLLTEPVPSRRPAQDGPRSTG